MQCNHVRSNVLALGLVLALVAGLSLGARSAASMAQGSEPKANIEQEAPADAILGTPLGSAFTYQGRLQKDGIPVDGTCYLQFSLWDALEGGNQVGSTLIWTDVPVSEGLFTVADLDFGPQFTGDARWLEIAVQCGDDPDYTLLSPRQALTAAPAALSLVLPFRAEAASGDALVSVTNGAAGPAGNFSSQGGTALLISQAGWDGVDIGSAGASGLAVEAAAINGLWVGSAGANGVDIGSAGDDGVNVWSAGEIGLWVGSAGANGVEVADAAGSGLYVVAAGNNGLDVGSAVNDGVKVWSAGGNGLWVGTAGANGVEVADATGSGLYVAAAGANGVNVASAGEDGVYVHQAGTPLATNPSVWKNGFEVAGAEGHGLYVGSAGHNGVYVDSAGGEGVYVQSADFDGVGVGSAVFDGVYVGSAGFHGVYVGSAGFDGVYVHSAGFEGVYVQSAGYDGVYAAGDHYAGYFQGDIYVTGDCIGCALVAFGLNAGSGPLQPGDVVSVQGMQATALDNAPQLWQVAPAGEGAAAVGVVRGRAELDVAREGKPLREGETGQRLVPRDGAAAPGEYVTVVFSGPIQVRASTAAGPIAAGARLAVGADGRVRALRSVTVEGIAVAESAPVLGIALEAAEQDGLIWVLVNLR